MGSANPYAPPGAEAIDVSKGVDPVPHAARITLLLAAIFGFVSACALSIDAHGIAARYDITSLVPFAAAIASTRERGWEGALAAAAMGTVFAMDRAARARALDARRLHFMAFALAAGYPIFCGGAFVGAWAISTGLHGLSSADVMAGWGRGATLDDWALGFGATFVNAVLFVLIVRSLVPAIANRAPSLFVKLLAALGAVVVMCGVEQPAVEAFARMAGSASAPQ